MHTRKKLGKGVFIFAIVIFSLSLFLNMVIGAMEASGDTDLTDTALALDVIDTLIVLVACITMLIQCFKVRGMLREHFNEHLGRSIPFSGVATFFFGIFYLQYKVNRLN